MQTTEQKPLIYQAMIDIMRKIEPVAKSRRNQQQNYDFRGIDDFYEALHNIMSEVGVFCLPKYKDVKVDTIENTDQYGKVKVIRYVTVVGKFKFVAADGSFVKASTIGEALDYADKATNKSLSAAQKYALLQVFLIPTKEKKDSENDHIEMPKQQQKPQNKPAVNSKPIETFELEGKKKSAKDWGMKNVAPDRYDSFTMEIDAAQSIEAIKNILPKYQ